MSVKYGDTFEVDGAFTVMVVRPAVAADFPGLFGVEDLVPHCWLAIILDGTTLWGIRRMGPGDMGPIKTDLLEASRALA